MKAKLPSHRRRALQVEALEDRTLLSTFTVDRLTDNGQGSGLAGDLRYCLIQATSGQDSISFGVVGTINLTQALPNLASSVQIDGPGADLLTVMRNSGGGSYRIFTVNKATTVAIAGLTIANGTTALFGGGIENDGTLTVSNSTLSGNSVTLDRGGGIYNSPSGMLTLNNTTVSSNRVLDPDGLGGGVFNDGTMTIHNSMVTSNHAPGGAGLYNGSAATLTIDNSTISTNTGANDGGAIYNSAGTLTISNSILSGNAAIDGGGGILSTGTLTVSNSTLSGNSVSDGFGSAIDAAGGTSVQISGCTLSGNRTSTGAGAIVLGAKTVLIDKCIISGNSSGAGGSIVNSLATTLTVSSSTISGNTISGIRIAGGIANNGTLTITSSTLSGNTANGPQATGAIANNGMLTMSSCTISGNMGNGLQTAGAVGGIANSGTLTVSNSTLSGNTGAGPQAAGGIATYAAANSDATVLLLSCTLSGNTIASNDRTGSQLYSGRQGTGTGQATVTFRNTLLSGDASKPNLFADVGGTFVSQGHNLSSDNGGGFLTGAGDLVSEDPLLGPLQDNGGPTQTQTLLPGSPALDAGDNTNAPDFDQRGPGFSRIVGGVIDIGALEVQPGPATHLQLAAQAQVTTNTPFDVTVAAVDAYGHTAVGYLGTVSFLSSDTALGVLLPSNYLFTAADHGVHVFTGGVTLGSTGSQTIAATDILTPSISGSISVIVALPPFLVTTTLDSGAGSLRQALLDADAAPGPNLIRFALGTGMQTISPAAPLPALTQPILLDGTTQPGYTGTPLIELNGAAAGPGADGLLVLAGKCVIRGLVINRFSSSGIELQGAGGNLVQGNYIGTDETGTSALGNGVGVHMSSSNNTIGGTTAGAGNVISGNLGDGVFISDNGSANVVQRNFIGTDASGTMSLENLNNGVHLLNASGNSIGGTVDGAANRIVANGGDGVLVDSGSGNAIQHNVIAGHTNGLGIELLHGGNNRLPFPVLTSVSSDGLTITLVGLLQSTPNTSLTLEFFANAVCNPSGFGEGEQFVGSSLAMTNSHGTASFTVTFASPAGSSPFVAATATDANNNTSPFSNCVVGAGPAAPPGRAPGTWEPGSQVLGMQAALAAIPVVAESRPERAAAWLARTLGENYLSWTRHATEVHLVRWHRLDVSGSFVVPDNGS